MIEYKIMLAKAIESEASDVHINIGMPPVMRINTELVVMDLPIVDDEIAKKLWMDLKKEELDDIAAWLEKEKKR